jgi:hypothetical protein
VPQLFALQSGVWRLPIFVGRNQCPATRSADYRYNRVMHNYRLVRDRSAVQVFVDGIPKVTVDANQRNELRNYMVSAGLTPDEVNHKVHELYITNTTEFTTGR